MFRAPLVILVLAGWAVSPPAVSAAALNQQDDADQQYTALEREYRAAYASWQKRYQAADQSERPNLARQNPAGRFAPRFLELARKHVDSPVGLKAVRWLFRFGRRDLKVTRQTVEIVKKNYVEQPGISSLLPSLTYAFGYDPDPLLRAVIERNPDRSAQGIARYVLARRLMRQNRKGTDKATSNEALKLMGRVRKDFADVKLGTRTLAKLAGGAVFELENLQIGMTVPDITGADVDGAAFKLSDYRGKVVMIDFWGDW